MNRVKWILLIGLVVMVMTALSAPAMAVEPDPIRINIQLRDQDGHLQEGVTVAVWRQNNQWDLCSRQTVTNYKGMASFTIMCAGGGCEGYYAIYVAGTRRGTTPTMECGDGYYKLIYYPPLPYELIELGP
jgi:hypothetical protein